MIKLKPSLSMYEYFPGMTVDCVISSTADIINGSYISYTAHELLKDLDLITPKGKINKKGKEVLCERLHYRFHANRESVIIEPKE